MARALIAVAAIVVVLIVVVGVYAAVTYPKATLTVPISFTFGADQVTKSFDQPFLNDKVQVQVTVTSGATLWNAQILNGTQVVWEHSAGQGEQTSYKSGWINLPSGSYDFTFRTVGIGSLNAEATVTSKGGFW